MPSKDLSATDIQILIERMSSLSIDKQHDALERHLGDDVEKLNAAKSMLRHLDEFSLVLGGLAGAVSKTIEVTGVKLQSGQQLGKYTLVRQLGEGGMGEVWLAEQHEPVHREVALKLLKPEATNPDSLARFRAERQALSQMNHSAVAQVYDADTLPDGRLYAALQYVVGKPITEYCNDFNMSVNERLTLFLKVCSGVSHLHRKGFIHRDIKPGNVLVYLQDGVHYPKIIDFGVAKSMTPMLSQNSSQTQLGTIIGTPRYMSPEQASGDPASVDVRSDVYSLGVLLYELLTNSVPLDGVAGAPKSPMAVLQSVREAEIKRPSAIVRERTGNASHTPLSTAKLAKKLEGDLDRIVLKALVKDPDNRYESAALLAADVERYLKSEPISVGPPTISYQLGKLWNRHRIEIGVAAVVTLAAIALAIVYTVQLTRAKDNALFEAQRSAKAIEFLTSIFTSTNPEEVSGRAGISAREILIEGANRADSQLNDDPILKSSVLASIGASFMGLGLFEEAGQYHKQALHLRRQQYPDSHPDVITSQQMLGNAQRNLGDHENAIVNLQHSVQGWSATTGAGSPEHASALVDLGLAYATKGEFDEAESMYRRALPVLRKAGDSIALALLLLNMGDLSYTQSRYESAIEFSEDARNVLSRLDSQHPMRATAEHILGLAYQGTDRFEEAETHYLRAIELTQQLSGDDYPDLDASYLGIGHMWFRQGDLDAAEKWLRISLEHSIRTRGREHGDVGSIMSYVADALARKGAVDEAESYFREAESIVRNAFPDTHHYVARVLLKYGRFLNNNDRPDEARKRLVDCVRMSEALYGVDDWYSAVANSELGESLRQLGKTDEATSLLESALRTLEETRGPDYSGTIRARESLTALKAGGS